MCNPHNQGQVSAIICLTTKLLNNRLLKQYYFSLVLYYTTLYYWSNYDLMRTPLTSFRPLCVSMSIGMWINNPKNAFTEPVQVRVRAKYRNVSADNLNYYYLIKIFFSLLLSTLTLTSFWVAWREFCVSFVFFFQTHCNLNLLGQKNIDEVWTRRVNQSYTTFSFLLERGLLKIKKRKIIMEKFLLWVMKSRPIDKFVY